MTFVGGQTPPFKKQNKNKNKEKTNHRINPPFFFFAFLEVINISPNKSTAEF